MCRGFLSLVLALVALQLSSALVVGVAMKTALVTGATDGIGRHTATRLAQDGWRVLVHGRNPARIDEAVKHIKNQAPDAEVESFRADFASLEDVRKLGTEVLAKHPTLDLLINNAGVYEESLTKTKDDHELTFQVNVLAPFLLTSLLLPAVAASDYARIIILLPAIAASDYARIIMVSSLSQSSRLDWDDLEMQKEFSSHGSYSTSKLCNAMHAVELASRLKTAGRDLTV
ncbi:hypothetical protein T484DRAFT_1765562 [Baffinella frigidus]|nr:hypothetical protein T484DRAFT_1765562 [Cryptophyta sp. CCMP2293]